MNRIKRIALEVLAPPALGAALMSAWAIPAMLTESAARQSWGEMLSQGAAAFVMVLLYAYAFAGVPSVVYAILMEWYFSRGLDPRGWPAVGFSTLLGCLSGAAILLVMTQGNFERWFWSSWFWCGLGAVVGFFNGALIRALARREG